MTRAARVSTRKSGKIKTFRREVNMRKKRKIIRIGTLICLLLFLLIPLLSSPVAAAFSVTARADTDNTTAGPAAWITLPGGPYPIIFPDVGQTVGNFYLEYYFNDNNGPGSGSWHRATMNITRNPGPNPGSTSTGWVFLGPGGSASGTLSIVDNYNFGTTYIWTVNLAADCWDNSSGPGSIVTGPGTYSVRVN